ncbi:Peptidase S8/S53 domain [Sesbania bispinosa]|nr:Peptidase S8/S53 domain [Sesbania bispinosa]
MHPDFLWHKMNSIGLHLLIKILTCILLLTQSYAVDDRKNYIVFMGNHPKGVKSTELLHSSMVQNVLGSKFAPDALLHSYKKSFNGFVARLTSEEALRMSELDGVVSVFPSKNHKLHTTRSWDFIGFPQDIRRTSIESDIIIGVIDTGIWPDKLIGAKYFRIDGLYGKDDIISPRDSNGHGTHCASTAAGNSVKSASLFGLASGTARGGVPSARIAVYKSCWSGGCEEADTLAAFDEAIADGVDIISLSVGPRTVLHKNYFEDIFAIGAFHAMKKGILTSTSAGNLGPQLYSDPKVAPWLLSVAASTIDRKFYTKVRLGDGTIFQGVSINTFDLKNVSYPLIYAGDAPNITGGYNSSISRSCLEGSLEQDLVKGKIVLCDVFRGSSSVGLVSGAAGILFRSFAPIDVARTFALPAIHLSENDGKLIHSYINSTRGPNAITPDILKPDLAAPGVDILAAWSPIAPISRVKADDRVANYNIISGTSMACPHATAAAAYVKSFHPNWSPAAIKSALMTTATPMSATLNPEAEFAYGAGQINPIKAVNPGLVYDSDEIDYVKFLCGQGYDTKKLQTITDDNSSCTSTNNGTAWDLNLPSFALSTNLSRSFSRIFHRTVTNVGSATSRYKARINAPPSLLNIKVEPDVLSFSSVGEKKSFTLRIEGRINVNIVSSSLVWDDGIFQVRSPIVVYAK